MADFSDLLVSYLTQPDPDLLEQLHTSIETMPNFDRDLFIAPQADRLAAQGDWAGLVEMLEGLMPGALLSPGVHARLGMAHAELGDEAAARREDTFAQVAMSSALSTGDGSAGRPWRVLRVCDEYDLLGALEKETNGVRTQRAADGRMVDVHSCVDGSEVHFVIGMPRPSEDAPEAGGSGTPTPGSDGQDTL